MNFFNDNNVTRVHHMSTKVLRYLSVAALAITVGASGCADPDEINRVQPDLIKKSDLLGLSASGSGDLAVGNIEFYTLGTVTRSPYATHYVFPGLQGDLQRGVWAVEKDTLFFYRTYEFVEGVEQQGIRGDADIPLLDAEGNPVTYQKQGENGETQTVTRYVYRSSPLKRFAISAHVDVRKTYNPLTGEESNVKVEDSSEKFWYERDYMRVDFGSNAAVDFAAMDFYNTPTIYEGEEGPEDLRLRVEDEGTYMDYVVRGYVEAPRFYFPGWGWIPTCLFYPWYTGAYYECDEEEIHVRQSFMKVRDNNSYKSLDFNDHMLNKFGYYRSSRQSHDQYFGRTFSQAIKHIRRFRIWEEYITDQNGELDYSQMTPNPIVYYLSEDFPRELIRGSVDLADQWNKLFQEVVETRMGRAWDGRMYVLCENNQAEVDAVLAADPDAVLASTDARYCKNMDQPKRYGDLRYNLLVSVNDPVQYGLYGYGPMHSDPVTGETVHANAFNYTANMRLGARTATDMIEYAAGVQSFRDITQARHITQNLKAKALKNTQGNPKSLSLDHARAIAGAVMPMEIDQAITAVGLDHSDTDHGRARLNRLLHTDEFDHLFMNDDMAALVGLPVTELGKTHESPFLRDLIHPANFASDDMLHWNLKRDLDNGQKAICLGEHFDNSFRGLALDYKDAYDSAMCNGLQEQMNAGADLAFNFDAFQEPGADCSSGADACGANQVCEFLDQGEVQGNFCMTPCSAGALLDQLRLEIRRVEQISEFIYWDPNALYTDTKDARVSASQIAAREIIEVEREKVFLDVFDRIWSTVAMHEVGHNVGLRHNFASSTDALNYFPGYWDIKGRQTAGGWEPYDLWESETEDQVKGDLRQFQQTSIMEYTGAFNARFNGLGSYDRGAILYGYGELVEIFDNPPPVADWAAYLEEPSDTDPDLISLVGRHEQPLAFALRKIHHTNYPDLFGGVDNILARSVVDAHAPADLARPCSMTDSPYDTTVCGAGSFCQPFPKGHFCTKPDMVEVPLRFCSDEYNWSSPTCQTHDEGTDMFEIVRNQIEDYEEYWPFRAYKRDNDLFSPSTGYWSRVFYQMYAWRKHFEHWAYDYARYNKGDWWQNRFGQPWHLDENGGLGQTLAVKSLTETMLNIFGRPNDAYYGFNQQREVYEPIVDNGRNTYVNVFQVREDQGARPMYPSYDFSGYLYTPARAGTFYDRLAAIMMMTYPRMLFFRGVDSSYDIRKFRVSFGSIFPQRMQNLLGGLVTSDPGLFGWCIEHDGVPPTEGGTGDPTGVKPRMWFGTEAELNDHYANCTPLNPEPQYDFPTTQYRLPAIATIYGMAWMSGTFDRSYIDRNRLWLKGDGSDIVIPAGFETLEYEDPFSGKTYVASYDPAEEDPFAEIEVLDTVPKTDVAGHRNVFWPAARLVALAITEYDKYGGNLSDLAADYQYSRLQETIGRLEILRGLYRQIDFGF